MLCYLVLLESDRDKERFIQLYQTHRSVLARIAQGFFSGNQTLSEDAVHNAFLSIAASFEKFLSLPCHEQAPYLVTTVKNACRDLLRKNRKYVGWDEAVYPVQAAGPNTDGLEESYRRAVEIICAMPEKYRAVLELRLLDGLSNAEAAKRLGIAENTASQRYHRGRKMVAEQLTKEGLGLE